MPEIGPASRGGASTYADTASEPTGTVPDALGATPARRSGRVRAERVVVLVAALVAVATPVVTALDVAFPGRAVLALLFVLAVPGVPLMALLRIPSPLVAASLAGAVSISFALLTAEAALGTGWWSPLGWAVVRAAIAVVASWWALKRIPDGRAAAVSPPVDARPAGRTRGSRWSRPLSVAGLVAALALWWFATQRVDLDAASGSGLAGVIGWPYLAAVLLVAAVAAAQLLRPRLDQLMLAATAVVLALVIFAFVNVADGTASVSTGWVHVGFARYIGEHHTSFNGLDARASWPAFFAATAQLVRLAGVPDASSFLQLSPFFYNAAAIAPLLVVARRITYSHRLAWLAVFIYLGANWFQQDYFSPQATAFLLYLVTLATLLWSSGSARITPLRGSLRARAGQAWRRRPGLPSGTTAGQSLGREAALLLIAGAIVVSHQLTPISLILVLLIFVVTGYTRHRRLWLVAALFFLAWFSFGATDFWVGHLGTVFGDLGRVGTNLNSAVTSRVAGNQTYQLWQSIRVGWSLVYAVLALIGLWIIRRRPDALLIALLAASAGSLVALQSYGGEVVLRSFLFAGPILASLAALALRALTTRRGVLPAVVLAAVLAVYGLLGTATRGVNVSFERVTPDDVAAAHVLWSQLRAGDTVGSFAPTGAVAGSRVGEYTSVPLDEGSCGLPPLECAIDKTPTFIVTSRTQSAEQYLVGGMPAGSAAAIADSLVRRGLYRVIYHSADAQVLELIPQKG